MQRGHGLIENLVVGVVGAYLGAFLFRLFGLAATGFIGALVVAIVGSVVLLAIVGARAQAELRATRTPTSRCAGPASRAPRCRAASCRSRSSPGDQTAIDGLAGRDRQDAAADAALAGQPDAVGEVARAVVVAAGQHQRVDPPGAGGAHHRMPGERVAAAGGEEEAGAGELAAAHGDGAVVEVDAEHLVDRVRQPVEGAHELRQRVVARAGRRLRAGDLGVDGDVVVVGEEAQEAQDLADRLARGVAGEHQVGDDDGAGVDEGIARPALLELELDDRVERRARRLAAHVRPQALADACRAPASAGRPWRCSGSRRPRRRRPRRRPLPSRVATARPKRRGSTRASCGM